MNGTFVEVVLRRLVVPCLLLAATSVLAGPAARAQTTVRRFQSSMAGVFHLNPDRGPLHHADLSPLEGPVSSEILAGPRNGLDSAFIVYTRMAPGAHPLGLYTLPVEQTYLVLQGRLNVQIGVDRFVADPDTLVLVPPGVPHEVWNAGGESEADLEVVAPASALNLSAMMQPAAARKVPDAAQYVHIPAPLTRLKGSTQKISFNERVLASRATGSEYLMERLGELLPDSKTHPPHIHPFDQLYFIRRGVMTFYYGLKTYEIPADTLIVIPAGIVHTDHNDGKSVLSFVQLIIPQPESGVPFAVEVHMQRAPGPAGSRHR